MSLRREFVGLATQPGANVRELCRRYGISPTTAYKWIERGASPEETYKDRSRRPHRSPHRTAAKIEEQILAVGGIAISPSPRSADLSSQDRDFLEQAAQGNNAEAAIGALAIKRSSDPAVIEFGKLMVADHSAANQKLAAIATQRNIALPTSLGEQQAGYDRLVSLSGPPFDREFAKVMLGDHQQAMLLYNSESANGIDPGLKEYAAAMLPKIAMHLAHAKALLKLVSEPQ